MATIPTPEQGKPILDFSAGVFDGNSNLFQSRNGATEHVSGDDVADYVNTSRIYNGLETESKIPVGAINEVNNKNIGDINDVNLSSPADGDVLVYDSTSSKWVNTSLNSTTSPLFGVKTYTYTAASVAAGENITISRADFSITDINGYKPLVIGRVGVSKAGFDITSFNAYGMATVLSVRNDTSAAIANTTFTIGLIYVKSDFFSDFHLIGG